VNPSRRQTQLLSVAVLPFWTLSRCDYAVRIWHFVNFSPPFAEDHVSVRFLCKHKNHPSCAVALRLAVRISVLIQKIAEFESRRSHQIKAQHRLGFLSINLQRPARQVRSGKPRAIYTSMAATVRLSLEAHQWAYGFVRYQQEGAKLFSCSTYFIMLK